MPTQWFFPTDLSEHLREQFEIVQGTFLREQDKEVRGFVLSDNLPIPNEVFGIPLKYNFYTIDKKEI